MWVVFLKFCAYSSKNENELFFLTRTRTPKPTTGSPFQISCILSKHSHVILYDDATHWKDLARMFIDKRVIMEIILEAISIRHNFLTTLHRPQSNWINFVWIVWYERGENQKFKLGVHILQVMWRTNSYWRLRLQSVGDRITLWKEIRWGEVELRLSWEYSHSICILICDSEWKTILYQGQPLFQQSNRKERTIETLMVSL